ncbi:MAG: hypothetical protein ACOC80_00775 [Petrotogales bacterium]
MKQVFIILVFLSICGSTFFSSGILRFPNADVYYDDGYKTIAIRAGNVFEEIRPLAIELVGNDPGRINIVVKDIGTVTNGYAVPQYHKTIAIYTWPPDSYMATRLNTVSWFRQVIIHEFTHIVHISYISGVNRFLTNLFTGSELLSPQYFAPFGESTTLLAESTLHFAEGRLNNPVWSRGMYLSSIKGNYFPDLAYALAVSDKDYRGGFLYYNYPAGFYKYLIEKYGLSKLKEFHSIVAKMPPVLGIVIASNRIFGKNINSLYNDWNKNLSEKFPLDQTPFKEVFTTNNGNITDLWSDKKLYFSYVTMGNVSSWDDRHKIEITSINNEGVPSTEVKGILPIRAKNDKDVLVIMQNDIEDNEYTRVLWKKDSKGWKELFRGNITAFEINSGDVYVAIYDQIKEKTTILINNSFLLETKFHVKDIEVSKNGKIALLVDDERRPGSIALIKSGALELILDDQFFKSSSIEWFNNRIIFTAAYNDNFMDVYAFEPETGNLYQQSEGMFFEKVVSFNNKIFGIGNSFEDRGMAVFEIEPIQKEIPIPKTPIKDIDMKNDYKEDNLLVNSTRYFINPVIRYPFVDMDDNGCTLGIGTIHVDPFEKHNLLLEGSYHFGNKQSTFNANYSYKISNRFSTQLNIEITPPSTITGTVSTEYLGTDTILKPGIRLNGNFAGIFSTDGNFEASLKTTINGDWWNIFLNPFINFTKTSMNSGFIGEISVAPTLNTLLKGSFDIGLKKWSISAVQNLFDIKSGRVPWFFASEITLGARIQGVSNNFLRGVLYITSGINDTWGFGVKMYPKIGFSLNDEFEVSLFFELTSQP